MYDAALERERGPIEALVHPGDVVVLHDPQTVGLTSQLVAEGRT